MRKGPTLRVVSYNVRYFGHAFRGLGSSRASKRGIATALADLAPAPDVICLQEVETRSLRSRVGRRPSNPEETQLESFMAYLEEACAERRVAMPYEAFHFRAHSYEFWNTPLYTTGLAILVNTRTLRVEAHNAAAPEAITHHHVARWSDRKQSRICAHVRLFCDGRTLHVFNTHLSLPTPFARDFWKVKEKMGFGVNQVQEARKLVGFLERHAAGDPFLLCGDFNSAPGSPVFRFLCSESGLSCAQLELGQIRPGTPRGFPTAGFLQLRMHLDHLFAGNGIRWLDLEGTRPFGEGPFHGLSDHMPLIARLEVPRAVEAREGRGAHA